MLIPAKSKINAAYLQLTAQMNATGALQVAIQVLQNTSSAAFFQSEDGDITRRPLLPGNVTWQLGNWTAGSAYQSPNIADLIGAVVDGDNWFAGRDLGLVLTPSVGAEHDAVSYDLNPAQAARLLIDYDVPINSGDAIFTCHFAEAGDCNFASTSAVCNAWTPGQCSPFKPVHPVPGLESTLYYRLRLASDLFVVSVYRDSSCTQDPTLGRMSAFDIRINECAQVIVPAMQTNTNSTALVPVAVLPFSIQTCSSSCPARLCECTATHSPTAMPTAAPTPAPTMMPTAPVSTTPAATTTTAPMAVTSTTLMSVTTTTAVPTTTTAVPTTTTTMPTTTTEAPLTTAGAPTNAPTNAPTSPPTADPFPIDAAVVFLGLEFDELIDDSTPQPPLDQFRITFRSSLVRDVGISTSKVRTWDGGGGWGKNLKSDPPVSKMAPWDMFAVRRGSVVVTVPVADQATKDAILKGVNDGKATAQIGQGQTYVAGNNPSKCMFRG